MPSWTWDPGPLASWSYKHWCEKDRKASIAPAPGYVCSPAPNTTFGNFLPEDSWTESEARVRGLGRTEWTWAPPPALCLDSTGGGSCTPNLCALKTSNLHRRLFFLELSPPCSSPTRVLVARLFQPLEGPWRRVRRGSQLLAPPQLKQRAIIKCLSGLFLTFVSASPVLESGPLDWVRSRSWDYCSRIRKFAWRGRGS